MIRCVKGESSLSQRDAASPVWAASCYFNTSESGRRLQNFRRFRERLVVPFVAIDLASFGFEPETDIAVDESGCWRWNSGNSEMHRYLVEYFRSRGM